MEGFIYLGLLLLLFFILNWHFHKSRRPHLTIKPKENELPAAHSTPPVGVEIERRTDVAQIYDVANSLQDYFRQSANPEDLLTQATFLDGVEIFRQTEFSSADLLLYAMGENPIISCMALEALRLRESQLDNLGNLLEKLNDLNPWPRFFALRVLNSWVPGNQPLLGRVLRTINQSWKNPYSLQFLRDFSRLRLNNGDPVDLPQELAEVSDEQIGFIGELLAGLEGEMASGVRRDLQRWRRTRVNVAYLSTLGQVWGQNFFPDNDAYLEHEALASRLCQVKAWLNQRPPRAVLLVGENGVGKTSLMRLLARDLETDDWVIFEAGYTEIIAGQVFIGELEARLRNLTLQLSGGRKVLWYIPEFHSLGVAGRHQYSATSALDYFLPYFERGEILAIGELEPAAYEQLVQSKPRCRTILETCRIEPLSGPATLELAHRWSEQLTLSQEGAGFSEGVLREAWQLTQQYLSDKASPGNLLQFLKMTWQRWLTGESGSNIRINTDDLVTTLAQLTGLPAIILDNRKNLDLAGLRQFFEKQVLGQPEAISCLVDCVSMIKAGLTDPSRPQGVFLFAGPTGTGKTEIAKALTKYLFGAPERMIRLDMSEFQTIDSLDRLLGTHERGVNRPFEVALVDLIRKQPFSVILLDECEKAHPRVWDLFLQVFDDGRLTDRQGRTADFRYAIIIMTSNLGGALPMGTSLGFAQDNRCFSPKVVERAIERAFRKEFLNRIDRTIVFRPLSRETMREILRKELEEAFQRRGLRNRSWAVEWEEGAIDFLLEKGFTPDLGARPLKRAVERYLLTPLANTIVNHQYPEGDQFLLVKGGGRDLEVAFIDPDAVPNEAVFVSTGSDDEGLDQDRVLLERIILDPRGSQKELISLQLHYERLFSLVESEAWKARKQAALSQMGSTAFWSSPSRFKIMGLAEYLDRIETGFETAGSLLKRVAGRSPSNREHFPRDLIQKLAQQLFLLEKACAGIEAGYPNEAFLQVEGIWEPGIGVEENSAFARQLGKMYRNWAERRVMNCEVLEERISEDSTPYLLRLAISGYAAYSLLAHEEGLHLLEIPESEGKSFRRAKVRVRVVPQPEEPPENIEMLREHAEKQMTAPVPANPEVVRRYREVPSPLVRDNFLGWRTGRLDKVWEGNFDLFPGLLDPKSQSTTE